MGTIETTRIMLVDALQPKIGRGKVGLIDLFPLRRIFPSASASDCNIVLHANTRERRGVADVGGSIKLSAFSLE